VCDDGSAGIEADARRWLADTAQALTQLSLRSLEAPEDARGKAPVQLWLRRGRAEYLAAIRRCQELLHDGETYEVCLTTKILGSCELDAWTVYRRLRVENPAPYAAFLRFGRLAIACSSPERFLRIDRKRWAESRPIKGTSARGATDDEDQLHKEALHSAKNRAENLMIVDLVRSDLGSVCEVGTVHVPELMAIESFSTVHQLVSTIRGHLREDVSALACVRAAFPGGSMTGAPKRRTMQILDELEGEARGIYAGSLGYLSCSGTIDLNIVIRTAVLQPGQVTIGTGGAIVTLSEPTAEFEEILLKAQAIARAVQGAAPGEPAIPVHVLDPAAEVSESK
jgi:para-aminobenzoate synthetase